MNKEQFKNLDILAQIEYVNNILKEGKTLTAFSEEVEISRKTISKNFSKFGYKYSQSKKQYILANTDVQAGGRKKYYSNITESNIKSTPKKESSIPVINNITTNIEKKEDIVRDIYNFKQAKRDYRAKTLKLDVEVQKGFEKIAEDLKDSGVTQQELLNYILNQYIKFYENIK